jgi:hypothetical protein
LFSTRSCTIGCEEVPLTVQELPGDVQNCTFPAFCPLYFFALQTGKERAVTAASATAKRHGDAS